MTFYLKGIQVWDFIFFDDDVKDDDLVAIHRDPSKEQIYATINGKLVGEVITNSALGLKKSCGRFTGHASKDNSWKLIHVNPFSSAITN